MRSIDDIVNYKCIRHLVTLICYKMFSESMSCDDLFFLSPDMVQRRHSFKECVTSDERAEVEQVLSDYGNHINSLLLTLLYLASV